MVVAFAVGLVAAVTVGGLLVTRYGLLATIIEGLRDLQRWNHPEP